MREIVSQVYLFEGLHGGNVYLVGTEPTLIDSGMPGDGQRIEAQLEEVGYAVTDLHHIVLTHAHPDHMGSVATLADRSGAQVLAHRDEVPYIQDRKPMPAISRLRRLLNWLTMRMLSTQPSLKVDQALGDGDTIEAPVGLQVVHTPGHTPGSICLYQPERRILFCGDAIFNRHPLTGREGLQFPLPMISVDWDQARASVRKLAALQIEVLLPGHGEPILGEAGDRIRTLLEQDNA